MEPAPQLLHALHRRRRIVAAAALAVVSLSCVNWILSPDHARRGLTAMVALPGLWLGLALWRGWLRRSPRRSGADDELAIERYALSALILVVMGVGIPQMAWFGLEVWSRLADRPADLAFARRIPGLAASAVVIVFGNALPKILTPLAILPLHLAERVTSARRFVGATFVMLGLAMAVGFLWLPLDAARTLARWAGGGGILTVLLAIIWMNAAPAGRDS